YYHYNIPIQIYTLYLHDALPISKQETLIEYCPFALVTDAFLKLDALKHEMKEESRNIISDIPSIIYKNYDHEESDLLNKIIEEADRKSTRLNSSHVKISYAVFCF